MYIAGAIGRIIPPIYSFSRASLTTPIWLDDLHCLGTESRLSNCPANPIGFEDCTHTQDVALFCTTSNGISQQLLIISLNELDVHAVIDM